MSTKTSLAEAFDYGHKIRWSRGRHNRIYQWVLAPMQAFFEGRGITSLDGISKNDILAFVEAERKAGNKESTISWKLSALSAVNTEAFDSEPKRSTREKLPRVRLGNTKAPKWWLRPEAKDELVSALRLSGEPLAHLMADYVEFVCHTGLRVEEALRLDRSHFKGLGTNRPAVFVPGTKTRDAAAWLPLSEEAAAIAEDRFGRYDTGRLFEVSYVHLSHFWVERCKPIVDPDGKYPTATLKALRRTFAWYATEKKMPTGILQKFLRHRHITTTVGYLNLIESSDVETLRGYL